MLVLRSLHNYLAQVLSPPYIHTALLLTPEGALVSYASRLENESDVVSTSSLGTTPVARTVGLSPDALPSGSPKSTESNKGTNGSAFEPGSAESLPRPRTVQPTSLSHDHVVPGIKMRSKDEVRIVAGLSSEVWAETRGTDGGEGMVESELGRILVLPVEAPQDESNGSTEDPLLLLALNGTSDARWETMSSKAHKLVAFLAPAVNKHRGQMQPVSSPMSSVNGPAGGAKSRTRSAATSPGRMTR